jgi:hypothetical protein
MNVISAVMAPKSGGASQGENPSKPRLMPAMTSSTLCSACRPQVGQSGLGERSIVQTAHRAETLSN